MSNASSPDDSLRNEIDARLGRTFCQRYTLEAVLGIGATGAVYRGSHRNGNRVAIKVLHTELSATKELREQFLREAKVANKVEHAGAVRILDDDTAEDGTVFLVMDLLEGKTLEAMMQEKGGKLPASELVPLTCQLLDVLAAAHEKGIVHRAVEPANVFVTNDRAVKLLGFGTARLADGSRLPARIGRAIETAAYLAPEQARGETIFVDALTDLWATGALMFRALSGAFVYPADTPEMVRAKAATQPAPAVRNIAPQLEQTAAEIVDRAVAWKKEDRWRNAQAMAAALRSLKLAGATGSQSAPPPAFVSPQKTVAMGIVAPMGALASSPPAAANPSTPPMGAHSSAPPMGVNPSAPPQRGPAQVGPPPMAPLAPLPGYEVPSSTDNGWIKWVAAAAALVVLFVIGGGVAAFLLVRSAGARHGGKPELSTKNEPAWTDEDSPIPVSSRDPVLGNRDAPVTIVVFSDFQCPFCSRAEGALDQVKSAYGADKVRIVWKNEPLPFHQNAKPAAEAAQVVFTLKGSSGFFAFHDLAFQNQAQLTPENFRVWAVTAGADGKAYDTAVASHLGAAKVDEDHALAKKVGVNGTPSFRINGVELTGAQPFDKFKQLIDAELLKASAKVASGTPKDKVYVVLSTEAFKQPTTTKDDDPPPDTTTVWRVPVTGSPIRGNVDAPVTIVEFGDFQCPFCKRAEQTVDKVRDTYGDKVRIVWKHQPLPFHNRAEPAAELALEARAEKGDAGFFRAHDKLFEAQPKLEDDDLQKLGAQLGLDASKVKLAIRDKKHAAEIATDVDLADDIQATGTPHFFINGRRLVGAQPFETFQKIIDEELKKFDAQKGNVAAKDYYAHLIREAKGPPEPEKKIAPPVPSSAPFRGGKDARVVIQQWGDFQCPFCARVEPTLTEVLKIYGDRVKIVWRDKPLPMHADAALAAELAREAQAQKGNDGFWKMHDKLFDHQQRLKRDDLDTYATELNLDMKKVSRALDGQTHKEVIDADDKLGTDLGLTGTPAFLINNYVLNGAQPVSKFKKLIDRALTER